MIWYQNFCDVTLIKVCRVSWKDEVYKWGILILLFIFKMSNLIWGLFYYNLHIIHQSKIEKKLLLLNFNYHLCVLKSLCYLKLVYQLEGWEASKLWILYWYVINACDFRGSLKCASHPCHVFKSGTALKLYNLIRVIEHFELEQNNYKILSKN